MKALCQKDSWLFTERWLIYHECKGTQKKSRSTWNDDFEYIRCMDCGTKLPDDLLEYFRKVYKLMKPRDETFTSR